MSLSQAQPEPGLLGFTRYLAQRLPLVRLLVPLFAAFSCLSVLYGALTAPARSWLTPGLSFLLLFIQLRLLDDLDDLEDELGNASPERLRQLRLRFQRWLMLTFTALVALNAANVGGLLAVCAATALAYCGPFVVKRWFPPRPAFLVLAFVVFEGAVAAIFWFLAMYWSRPGTALAPLCTSATLAFWLAYEFWKFSRKVHLNAFQPYFLERRGIRVALSAFLVCSLPAHATLAAHAELSPEGRIFLVAFPLVLLGWVNWSLSQEPKGGSTQPAPAWSGMAYMCLLEVGVALGLAHSWPIAVGAP